jgi:hypothetical protein
MNTQSGVSLIARSHPIPTSASPKPRQENDMNDSRELHAEKARPDEGITAQDDPTEKIEMTHLDETLDLKAGAHKSVGLAVIGQTHTIPTTGERKVTTKMEYWTYCIFCEYMLGRRTRCLR